MAYRGNWFERLTDETGRFWLTIAILLIVTFPVFIYFSGAPKGVDSILGGINRISLYYSVWEQFVCVGMILGLSTLFRSKINHQGTLAKAMSASAYTVFIIHAPVLIFLALALKNITLYPLLKFIIVAPVAVSLCFVIGNVVRKLPYARKIL